MTSLNNEVLARWYVMDVNGVATLCADEADAISTAEDARVQYPNNSPYFVVQLGSVQMILELAAQACEARIGKRDEGLTLADVADCDIEAQACADDIRKLIQ